MSTPDPTPNDPVLAQRARYRAWASRGQRLGLGLYGVAFVAIVVGIVVGFGQPWAGIAAGALVVGSVVLAPAILLAYLVRGAERHEADEAARPRPGRVRGPRT